MPFALGGFGMCQQESWNLSEWHCQLPIVQISVLVYKFSFEPLFQSGNYSVSSHSTTCANYYKPVYIKIPLIGLIKRHPLLGGSEEMNKRIKECNSKQQNELQMNSLHVALFLFLHCINKCTFFGWSVFCLF